MSNCLKIRVKGTIADLTSSDGYMYLDLDKKTKIRETKRLTERTDLNQLKFDYVLSISLPTTPKNFKIFERFLTLNRDVKDFSLMPVQVLTGSSILDDTFIYVTECTRDKIDVQLFLGKNHWIMASKDLTLSELDLGSVFYNELLIFFTNYNTDFDFDFNNGSFTDADIEARKGMVFPLAEYGNLYRFYDRINANAAGYWTNQGQTLLIKIPQDYWRPLFVVKYLLEKGFCQIGWKFKSDLFDTEYGRRIVAYLTDKDYGKVDNEVIFSAGNTLQGLEVISTKVDFFGSLVKKVNKLYRGRLPFRFFSYGSGTLFDVATQTYAATGELVLKGKVELFIYSDKNFLGSKRGGRVRLWIGTDTGRKITSIEEVEVTKFYSRESPKPVPSIPFAVNLSILDQISQVFIDTIPSIDEYTSESEEPAIESEREILREGIDNLYDTINIEYDITDFCIYYGEKIVFYVEADNRNIRVIVSNKSYIQIFREREFVKINSQVDVNSFLSPNITFLDLLKGITHAFNLKWTTDFLNKTVEAYPLYDIGDLYGKDITRFPEIITNTFVDGLFIEEELNDISDIVDKKSEKILPPPMDTPRYVHITWKDSNDAAFDGKFEERNKLFSRFIDFGDKFENVDVKEISNPLFAATRNTYFEIKSPFPRQDTNVVNDPIELPNLSNKTISELSELKLKDNELPCANWDIEPRLLYWFGDVQQSSIRNLNPDMFIVSTQVRYSQVNYTVAVKQVPTALQASSYLLTDRLRKVNITFGTNNLPEFSHIPLNSYHLFYARELGETLYNQKIEYLVNWSKERYRGLNFRQLYYFQSRTGEPIFSRLIELRDYEYCSDLFTPTVFQVRKLAVVTECADDGTELVAVVRSEPRVCNTFPTLKVIYNDNCLIMSIEGIIEDPITATFEYSDTEDGLYVSIPNTTPTGAILCDVIGDIFIRAVVDIDNTKCQDVTLTSFFSICDNLAIGLDFTIISLNTITGLNVHQAIVTGDTSGYIYNMFYDIGSGFVPYTLGGFIQNENIVFKLEYSKGICIFEDIIKSSEIELVTPESLCGQVNASIEIIDTLGTKTFNRVGFIISDILSDDYILYRVNSNDPFVRWDEVTGIVTSYLEGMRIIIYDRDICPEYFSSIVNSNDLCDCIDLDITITLECNIYGYLVYSLIDNTIGCNVPAISEIRWYEGVYLSGIASTFVHNLYYIVNPIQADYRIEIDFGSCTISSGVVSLEKPPSGLPILIAGK